LPSTFADQRELVTPMSGLSIALVVSIDSLHHDPGLPWIITAVIGGSIATEFLLRRTSRDAMRATPATGVPVIAAPVDELHDLASGEHEIANRDEHDGPIYRDEGGQP